MSTHDIQSLLSDNEGHSDDEKDQTTVIDDKYYHHDSGPFDKKDGSYRHRNPSSPRPAPVKTPKLHYSWSNPDLSLYSQPLKSSKNAKIPSPYKPIQKYEYQQIIRDIIRADVPIIAKSFILCPVQSKIYSSNRNRKMHL